MQSKKGEILPNIVDSKNKMVKQVRLEEIREELKDKNKTDKFSEYTVEQKLDAVKEQLESIMLVIEDIEKSQRNDRYAKVDGAEKDIKQSFLEDDVDRQNRLQDMAQSKLNEVIEALSKEINDAIGFFIEWEERNFIQKNIGSVKFSTWNIDRRFNKLCEDYLYLTRAKALLIELKICQGMDKNKVNQDSNIPSNNKDNYWKNLKLHQFVEKPLWIREEKSVRSSSTLKLDVLEVDKKSKTFRIYDAKYYTTTFEENDDGKLKISKQMGVGEITKQYLYQLAYKDLATANGYSFSNVFVIPQDDLVEEEILHGLGKGKVLGRVKMNIMENLGLMDITIIGRDCWTIFNQYLK